MKWMILAAVPAMAIGLSAHATPMRMQAGDSAVWLVAGGNNNGNGNVGNGNGNGNSGNNNGNGNVGSGVGNGSASGTIAGGGQVGNNAATVAPAVVSAPSVTVTTPTRTGHRGFDPGWFGSHSGWRNHLGFRSAPVAPPAIEGLGQ